MLAAIAGKPATGKTTSILSLDPKSTNIIAPSPISLKGYKILNKENKDGNLILTNRLEDIPKYVKTISDNRPHVKVVVTEDMTHFMHAIIQSPEFRAKGNTKESWSRFDDYAASVFDNSLKKIIDYYNTGAVRSDLHVIAMYHLEEDSDGDLGIHTCIGKKLKNLMIESYYDWIMCTRVIDAEKREDRYRFQTYADGPYKIARSPLGAFDELFIPNNLQLLVDKMNEFI